MRERNFIKQVAALVFGAILMQSSGHAEEIKAAVAANFAAAIKQLTPLYEAKTGNKLLVSYGATGQLYAQITSGAPFDLFFSADDQTPLRLIKEGLAIEPSHFVYAAGKLALWSAAPRYIDDEGTILKKGTFEKIAVANPKTAPYGKAAIETLTSLGLLAALQPKFIVGENIAQTQQFVITGAVPLGFIALAQVLALPESERGSYWLVPAHYHRPILQGAVLLSASGHKAAAESFLAFVKSPEATAIIHSLGYDTPAQ